jgi:hypothetical protein
LKTSIAFLTATYILAAPSPSAEIVEKTVEIRNASWQKVPDTTSTEEGYTDSAFLDINGISRNGDLVIFDVVNSDASYGRVEGNCRTNQIRSLRMGNFLSDTQVSYIEQDSESLLEANPYQIKLLKFACNASFER